MTCLIEFKDQVHEREIKANSFHCDEVHELRERILAMYEEAKLKEETYETIQQTVDTMNATIPKLINDKIYLEGELK